MRKLVSIALLLTACTNGLSAPREVIPIRWEHGWKTPNVTATRYKNDLMGFNIGFVFPHDPENGDRAELFEFMSEHDGVVYAGGGYPGAPLYTIFKDVKDKETADKKLQEVLPKLEALIVSLR